MGLPTEHAAHVKPLHVRSCHLSPTESGCTLRFSQGYWTRHTLLYWAPTVTNVWGMGDKWFYLMCGNWILGLIKILQFQSLASFAIQMQLKPSFQTGIKCVLMNNEKLNFPYSSLCSEINMGEKESLGCQINQRSANGLSAPDNEESNYSGTGYNLLSLVKALTICTYSIVQLCHALLLETDLKITQLPGRQLKKLTSPKPLWTVNRQLNEEVKGGGSEDERGIF